MLLSNLYNILTLEGNDHEIRASLLLNADHAIFRGHFPGHPVLPGVCMLEMISEVLGSYTKQVFRISGGPVIKFLRMIDPGKTPKINVEIKYEFLQEFTSVEGKIFYDTLIFMKFRMNLISYK